MLPKTEYRVGFGSNPIYKYNKFPEIEKIVNEGEPVYLTKNGYGAMVVLSLDKYSQLTDDIGAVLDETDKAAGENSKRMTHEEVFGNLQRKINAQ